MKKKNGFILIIFVVVAIMLFSIVNASISVGRIGNTSRGYSLSNSYSPTSALTGTLNVSLTNEPFNSNILAQFNEQNDRIDLKNFLDNAGAGYTCSSSSCGMVYSTSGSGESSKVVTISAGSSKLVGLKISGNNIAVVSSFIIAVASNAASSCITPLKIDVLNDGSFEWTAHNSTSDACSSNEDYGCYESSRKQSDAFITTNLYCEKITVSPSPKIKIGADISGAASGIKFIMSISSETRQENCEFIASSSGEQGCIVNISTVQEEEFDVCINAKTNADANNYTLGTEAYTPCGYSGDEVRDFAIFAKPLKYDAVGSFGLRTSELQTHALGVNSDLESYVSDFIDSNFSGRCSDGCIIPINFSAGVDQEIILSGISLFYESSGGVSTREDKIYDLSLAPSTISMNYSLLDLSKADLNVPPAYGNITLDLTIGDTAIISNTQITVLQTPIINLVYPQKVPAGIEVIFKAYTSGANISSYGWDFGDNSTEQQTSGNTVEHRYANMGSYTLTLTVENSLGTSTKSFVIQTLSPADYIVDIINQSRVNIAALRININTLPAWIKNYIQTIINPDTLEAQINTLNADYLAAGGSSSTYVEIVNSLQELNIPSSIDVQGLGSIDFMIDKTLVDISVVQGVGAGTPIAGKTEIYRNAIYSWTNTNLNINVEGTSYSSIDDVSEPIASAFRVSILPRGGATLGEIYMIINRPLSSLTFSDSSLAPRQLGDLTGIVISNLGNGKTIEFLTSGNIGLLEAPFYLMPKLSALSLVGTEIDVCNNNGECDRSKGENWKNCRTDCKPIGTTFLWIFFIFFLAFCAYIAAQEWYKKRYEDFLFKNKNDLFNLINFIDNAAKQGMKKEEDFKKLNEKGWTKEQMVYAWKKVNGERTGMWEIPIFRIFEMKKVREEIAKRRQAGNMGQLPPIPLRKTLNASVDSINQK